MGIGKGWVLPSHSSSPWPSQGARNYPTGYVTPCEEDRGWQGGLHTKQWDTRPREGLGTCVPGGRGWMPGRSSAVEGPGHSRTRPQETQKATRRVPAGSPGPPASEGTDQTRPVPPLTGDPCVSGSRISDLAPPGGGRPCEVCWSLKGVGEEVQTKERDSVRGEHIPARLLQALPPSGGRAWRRT